MGISPQYLGLQLNALDAIDKGVEVYSSSGDIALMTTQMVARLHGDWNEKRKVADKVNSEKLSQRQIGDVVKVYNTASTAEEKKKVLQVKHPKRKDVTFEQAINAVELLARRKTEKRRQAETTDEPIVKNYMDAMTAYRDAIKEARESSIRFAPEASQFVVRRHNLITKEMLTLKEVLENG